jgi:hypothetical protein
MHTDIDYIPTGVYAEVRHDRTINAAACLS